MWLFQSQNLWCVADVEPSPRWAGVHPKEHVFVNIEWAENLITQLKYEALLDRLVQDYKHVGIK